VDKRPGCLTLPALLTTTGVAVLTLAVLLVSGGRPFSPGQLSAQISVTPVGGVSSHAALAGDCAACHPAPWSGQTMADLCVACHTDVAAQLGDPATLHGSIAATNSTLACRACHPEHRGATAALTEISSQRFPHVAVGFSLQAHQTTSSGAVFACTDCHTADLIHFDQATCADCHRGIDQVFTQAHRDAFGGDCLACHDGVDRYGKGFSHDRLAFRLEGKHAAVACSQCHSGARTIADLSSAPQDCYSCHQKDDSHQGQLGQDCAACHTPADWQQATFDHGKSAFPLTGAHAQVQCAQCHTNGQFKGTPTDCYSCHQKDDTHQGGLGQDCAACHTTASWQQATFDHSKSAFPLTGAHANVECAQCHVDNQFKGTPTDCYSCHQKDDAHQGQFGQDCGGCHTPVDWKQATFDHSKSAFPLAGAHLKVDCTQCHTNGQFKGTPIDCAACHQEPAFHAGLFQDRCGDCHSADAWSPAKFDQPHTFPINHGERGGNACTACHPDTLKSYTCYTCHDEARTAAQHSEEGIANLDDCARCHPTGQGEGGD
jgi:hypothetical protein